MMKTVQKIINNTLVLPEELHELNNKHVIINVGKGGKKNTYMLRIEVCNVIERGETGEKKQKKKKSKLFSEEEIKYIIENYPKIRPVDIARKLGKNRRQVNQMIYVLRKKGLIKEYRYVVNRPKEEDIIKAINEAKKHRTELEKLAKKIRPNENEQGRKRKFSVYALLQCALLAKILNISYTQISMIVYENEKIRELLNIPEFEYMYSILSGLKRLPIKKYEKELEAILKLEDDTQPDAETMETMEKARDKAVKMWIDIYMPYELIAEGIKDGYGINTSPSTVKEWIDEYIKDNINSFSDTEKKRILRRKVLEKEGRVVDIMKEINKEFGAGLSIRTVIRWIRQYEKFKTETCKKEMWNIWKQKKSKNAVIDWLKDRYGWDVLYWWEVEDELFRIMFEKGIKGFGDLNEKG